MNRSLLVTCIVTGVLTAIFSFMAIERTMAANETSAALSIIDQGLDWDGETPISAEQQADRMNANLDVLSTQTSQRNTQGILAILMLFTTGGTAFMMQKNQ